MRTTSEINGKKTTKHTADETNNINTTAATKLLYTRTGYYLDG